MKNIHAKFSHLMHIPTEADYFRESSFLTISLLTLISAWLWVGQVVVNQSMAPLNGLLLFALVGLTTWLVYKWYREHYFRAALVFLLAQVIFFAVMIHLLDDLELGYLFLFTVFTAGALIGPAGAFGAATLALMCELLLLQSLPETGLFPVLVLLQYLAAVIAAQASRGFHSALQAAESQASESRSNAAEARQHRGELHKTLKSLDMAYLQLERINGELLQARAIANEALNFKKEFVTQTSHELRTPLNLIIGFSETMAFSQNSYGVKLPAPYLRDVTEIYRNSRHLLSLIDDILDLAKLESGRMGLRFNPADVQEICQSVHDTIQPLTQAKGLDLRLELPSDLPRLWIDRARIHQVLLNLISNAARLTKHGAIHLHVEFRENRNDLLFQVTDTGPGIPADQLAQIFEEFQQAPETSGTSGTTGLGLTISQRIVELHGGHMWAESVVGQGSTFSFNLPVYKPLGDPRPQPQTEQPQAVQPSIILLADENAGDFGLLQRHLDGYLLTSAPDWEVASQLVSKVQARAIISGHEPPAHINLSVPVIVCPLPSSHEMAQAWSVDGYVRKPLTIRALRSALRQHAPEATKLLLVNEDSSSLRLVERMVLGLDSDYQVSRAYDTAEALERLRSNQPDAVLLDLGATGSREFIRQVKAQGKTPVLALSGLDLDDNLPSRPIYIASANGFTVTEILKFLQGILSVVPPQ
ncbi:MAG TPA: ATP-binding protein [Anaerolineales bacterium]|nr:ATP-binding protein [Anaerolineales bacterium]